MWVSGESSNEERATTSLVDWAGANRLSQACWILTEARINDRASGPDYDESGRQ
jgi:hypothetical protein